MSIKRTIIATVAVVASVAMVAPSFAGADTISDLMAQIAALQAQLVALQGQSAAPAGTGLCAGVTFTRNLTVGSTGSDVKCLQTLLNQSATTKVASTGAGSPGSETTYFGSLTLAAVKVYQAEHGWTPANQVGPLTRQALNAQLAGSGSTGGNVVLPTGPVSAVLAFDNPAAGTLIGSQASADMLHVNFTGSGTVTSVTLKRTGVSDQNLFTNIYLYDGSTRLTDGYSFNINGTATINGLNIAVSGSKVISVKGDVMASAASTQGSAAVALTDYIANGSAVSANVQGNMMSVISGSAATATLGAVASTRAPTASINAGTSQYTVWSDTVAIATRTVQLKGASFRMIGSAPTDALANVKMYVDGVDTGAAAVLLNTVGSTYQSFVFATPISLTTGSHVIDVRADIQKGTNRNFQLSLQQAADLVIYDPQIGVNVAASGTPDAAGTMSINYGSVSTSLDPTFTSSTSVTGGASNTIIARYVMHAYGEDVKVSSLTLTPTIAGGTPATTSLNNVTLYLNGVQVGSQQNYTTTALTFQLGSQMILAAGQDSKLEVRADMQNASNVSYTAGTVSVSLAVGSSNGTGQSSQTLINVPAATSATSGLSISTGGLAVAKNTTYTDQTIAPNSTGAKIASFVLQNQGTTEAVRLTSLNLVLTTSPTGSTGINNLSSMYTSENTGYSIQPTGNDTFTINSTLQPGATKTIDVFANTGSLSSASTTVQVAATVASIGVTSNSTSAGSSTPGQTITLNTGAITNSSTSPSLLASSSTGARYIAAPNGATDATTAAYVFKSTGGSSIITELKFTATGSTTLTSVKVGSVSAPFISGTAWLNDFGTPVNGVCPSGKTCLVVPNGGSGLTVTAILSYPTVGTTGLSSDTTSYATLSMVKYTSGTTTTTLGTGGTALSSTLRASNTMTLTASTPTVRKTSTAVSESAGSTSNVKVGTITITANGGDVVIGAIPVSIGYATGGTNSNWLVKVGGTAPAGITQPTSNTSGFSFADGYQISKDQSVAFDIYVDVTGVTTAGNADITIGAAASFTWSDILDGTTTTATMTKTGALLSTYNQ